MIVTNKITGKDVSAYYLQLMKNEITNKEFRKLAGLRQDGQGVII